MSRQAFFITRLAAVGLILKAGVLAPKNRPPQPLSGGAHLPRRSPADWCCQRLPWPVGGRLPVPFVRPPGRNPPVGP